MQMPNKFYLLFFFVLSVFCITATFTNCKQNNTGETLQNKQIEIGRYLFFDRRLSINNTRSCATCHNPDFAFTDGYKRSLGAFADLHIRNTQPIFNLSQLKYFTSADSNIHNALTQMQQPLFGTHVIEMGVGTDKEAVLQKISNDNMYENLFAQAALTFSWDNILKCIAQFENNITSYNSAYDKFLHGDKLALNKEQKKGMNLFFSNDLKCASCHGGINFSSPNFAENKDTTYYFNIGLYNVDGKNNYPNYDQGLYNITKSENDKGKFRVPTLRNLAFTAPYFHDGSAASLTEVVNHYAKGGRTIFTGAYKGNGASNKFKHAFIGGFKISEMDKINLIQFLLALSDSGFIKNASYQNPFKIDETKY
jgi:cytochrome c peroxidase